MKAMYIIARNSLFGHGQDVAMRATETGDLQMTVATLPDGSPDWSISSIADPRGCDTDEEWLMCQAMAEALVRMRDA